MAPGLGATHPGYYGHFLQTGYAEARMNQGTHWDMEVDCGGKVEGVSPLVAVWEKLHFFFYFFNRSKIFLNLSLDLYPTMDTYTGPAQHHAIWLLGCLVPFLPHPAPT